MNKKLSLMLAAFVAAGYSLTAEAGVVKVTNPTNGNSYVIAQPGWGSTAKVYLTNASGTVQGSSSVDAKNLSLSDADMWKYEEVTGGFKLLQSTVGISEKESDATKVDLRLAENASVFSLTGDVLTNENGKKLTFSVSSAATWSSGTQINFYAYTDKAEVKSQVTLKVGDKYLVVADATTKEVKLVDEDTYQAYLKLGQEDQTLWSLNAQGQYTSEWTALSTNNYLQITSSGVKVGASTSASTFELNAD